MSDLIFNVAKGAIKTYAGLPAAADSIIAIPLLAAGLVPDATMRDYTNLSLLLAGATDEQTAMGRKTVTNVVVNVDQANDRTDIDSDDVIWTGATGGPIGAILFCYKPDTASADTEIVPMAKYDFAVTPNGGDITAQIPAAGFLRAS